MTFLEIVQLLISTARQEPNINTVVREFTDLNRENIDYSAIVIQDRDGYRDYINNQDYITYTWYIGYVDMLTEEVVNSSYLGKECDTYDNSDHIISTGITVINDIINTINSSYYPHLELTVSDRINTFHQRFTAECAGVYMVLNANVPLSDCSDSDVKLFSNLSSTITENGVYHYVPSGEEVAYDGVDITVDVSSEKEEQSLYEEVTWNGDFEWHPDPGKVFKDVEVIVDVHPSTSLSASYTSNGSYNISGEFDGGVVTVAVPSDQKPEQVGSFEVTDWNTTYRFTPDPGYVFSEVDVLNNTPVKSYVSTVTSNSRLIWNAIEGEALVNHIDISIAVPSDRKPEESLAETISSNGSYSFSPSSGSVFSDASIAVDVHPSASLSETYTSNGSYSISGEFDGGVVMVAVPSTVTVTMTQDQYDALQVKDPNTIYLING